MPATTVNNSRMQLLADWGLQCRLVGLPSERLSTRASHIQCSSPSTSGDPPLSPNGSLRMGYPPTSDYSSQSVSRSTICGGSSTRSRACARKSPASVFPKHRQILTTERRRSTAAFESDLSEGWFSERRTCRTLDASSPSSHKGWIATCRSSESTRAKRG